MTELSNLGADGLFKQVPEFLLVDDESSTYPLLTPSPPADFDHPLALDTPPVVAYERQLSPSSIDTDLSSMPTLSSAAPSGDYGALASSLPPPSDAQPQPGKLSEVHSGMGSSSSSSSVLQDTTASAQLLNPHHYLGLSSDTNCQENGGINGGLCGLTLGSRKNQDFIFLSWNWPLIRKCCFWGMMSLTVAFVCVIIGYITTLPSRCDPPRAWFQGSLIYEIFPGSFYDTTKDGVGDLKGISAKVHYLESMGVRGIRLNSIFPSEHYPEHYYDVENLTQIQATLGTFEDFKILVNTFHEMNISVILDLPLGSFFKRSEESTKLNSVSHSHHMIINNHILNSNNNKTNNDPEPHTLVTEILDFWLNHGVDGFYLKDIEGLVENDNFQQHVREWKGVLKRHKTGFDKILICSERLINVLENNQLLSAKLTTVLTHFDLVDYSVELSGGLKSQLERVQGGVLLSRPGYPWPMWSLGSVDTPRLASRLAAPNASLAAVLVAMMLPGTPSMLYGDEIGLENWPDNEKHFDDISHVHQLVMMQWESHARRFTGALDWIPRVKAHMPLDSARYVSEAAVLRDSSPAIYMHAIWRDSALLPNTAVKYMDETLIVLERLYPRRHSYVIIANLGRQTETRDLSRLFYGGHVVLSTGHHADKYLTFHKLVLYPGEAIVIRLDK